MDINSLKSILSSCDEQSTILIRQSADSDTFIEPLSTIEVSFYIEDGKKKPCLVFNSSTTEDFTNGIDNISIIKK